MSSSVELWVYFRSLGRVIRTGAEIIHTGVGQQATNLRIIRDSNNMMGDGDTHMEDTQPPDRSQQAVSLQVAEELQQVKAGLSTLNDAVQKLPNDVAIMLRGREGDLPASDAAQVAKLQDRVFELETTNATLLSERAKWKQVADAAEREHGSMRSVLQQKDELLKEKDEQLRSLCDEMGKMRHKETALRTIILDKAGVQKVSDQEVTSRFTGLRQRIQTIARLQHYRMDQVPPSRKMEPDAAMFYEEKTWNCLTIEERTNRVRSKMFDFIHDGILSFPLFGLEGYSVEPKDGSGDDRYLTPGLRRFERVLEENKVPAHLVSDWRILTIECGDKLRHPSTMVATKTAESIFDFFRPLLIKPILRREEEELRTKITELCSEAFDLKMIMRRSKDRYMCEVPGLKGLPTSASQLEVLAETVAVEGGKPNQASDEIAFTLFGALVKQTDQGDSKKMVLEKAEVILKRR